MSKRVKMKNCRLYLSFWIASLKAVLSLRVTDIVSSCFGFWIEYWNQNRSRREVCLYWNHSARLSLDRGAHTQRFVKKKESLKGTQAFYSVWYICQYKCIGFFKVMQVWAVHLSSALLFSPSGRWILSNQQHLFAYHQERSHRTTSAAVFRPLSALMHVSLWYLNIRGKETSGEHWNASCLK